jgi:hypothetical protein
MPWIDPCGRKVDWGRSCYDIPMSFDPAADPVTVRWYFADEDQPWVPDGNQFVSLNWDGPDRSPNDLGEQDGPRPWRNGKNEKLYPLFAGDGCDMDPLLLAGLSGGATTGPWDTAGVLGCCTPTPCCPATTDVLHATVTPGSGCPCLDGVSVDLAYDSLSGNWFGSATVCSSELFTLEWRCVADGDCGLTVFFENHGTVADLVPSEGCCSMTMTFPGIEFPIQGIECDGAIQIVVVWP